MKDNGGRAARKRALFLGGAKSAALYSSNGGNMKVLLCALLVLCFSSTAYAGKQAPGTIAFDFRNSPNWKAIADSGYSAAVISPRAQTTCGGYLADSLRSRGLRVWLWTQPWLGFWNGQPIRDWEHGRASFRPRRG